MKIQVSIRNVYGNQTIYPACTQSKLFATLVSQATLTSRDIKIIKELGYSVEVAQEVQSL